MSYLIFDIGGSSIKWANINRDGEFLIEGSIPRQVSFENMISEMFNVYRQMDNLAGISIAAPGCVDSSTGIIGGASALDYIHGPNFKEIFKSETGFDIAIENDANCAALAECYFSSETKYQDIAYVVMGSGIGGALIKNRQLHLGANRFSGEFGYMFLNQKLETWSELGSTVNLVNRIRKLKNDNTLEGVDVFELAKTDQECAEIVEDFYLANAMGLYNIQYAYDPEVIYIGGAISANKEVIENIKRKLKDITNSSIGSVMPNVEIGKHQKNANILGALANLLY